MKTLDFKNGGQRGLTTDPVRATPAYVAAQDPEFLDAAGVRERLGIKRSLLYELINLGCRRLTDLAHRQSFNYLSDRQA